MPDNGRVPPSDVTAEKAVLGSLFHDLPAGAAERVFALLGPEDFYREKHRHVFMAALRLFKGGAAVDPVAMRKALDGAGALAKVGGAAYIAELMLAVPTSANAVYYAGIVRDKGIRRAGIHAARDLVLAARDDSKDVAGLVAEAHDRLSALRRLTAAPADEAPDGDLEGMDAALDAQATGAGTLSLPWRNLSTSTRALRPGTVCVLAGPPCVGKSLFTMAIVRHVHGLSQSWRCLPLEDDREQWCWRMLGVLSDDYVCLDDEPGTVGRRRDLLRAHRHVLGAMAVNVAENPRAAKRDAGGRVTVAALPYGRVLDWIGRACDQARVVFVDPMSQIEFGGRAQWESEQDFVRQVLAIVAGTRSTLFLVAHTVKRPGKAARLEPTLEDIQGAAMIGRLCQTGLIIYAHNRKRSEVYARGGGREDVSHNRTALMARARSGPGTGQRVAFCQDPVGPRFTELGVIAPKGLDDDDGE